MIIALDIYGTVLAADDYDNCYPPRKGIETLFDKAHARNIRIVASSDVPTATIQCELEETFKKFPQRNMNVERFHDFFWLYGSHKNFDLIIQHYAIEPHELFVIGDNPHKDRDDALAVGAQSILVPQYRVGKNTFDMATLL